MSRTRNQRKRDNLFDRIFTLIMLAFVIALTVAVFRSCRDINELQEKINGTTATVVRASDYLPSDFDRAAFEAASYRYEIEQGHIIPEQKETAPEAATSEADRCKGAS